jgi:predicted nuclease with RNAse H fold
LAKSKIKNRRDILVLQPYKRPIDEESRLKAMLIVGLDLAGVETRPTGFCLLAGVKAETCLLYTNEEILKKIGESAPQVIAIDAPLSLPPGRKTIEDRSGVHLRESDRELLKKRIKFFPITLGPMRKLTERGIYLRRVLESKNFRAIEVYPGGAKDVLEIPRKQKGLDKLKAGLEKLGIEALKDGLSDHELDAVTCAFVGKLFLEGKSTIHGEQEQGIVMPKAEKSREIGL